MGYVAEDVESCSESFDGQSLKAVSKQLTGFVQFPSRFSQREEGMLRLLPNTGIRVRVRDVQQLIHRFTGIEKHEDDARCLPYLTGVRCKSFKEMLHQLREENKVQLDLFSRRSSTHRVPDVFVFACVQEKGFRDANDQRVLVQEQE